MRRRRTRIALGIAAVAALAATGFVIAAGLLGRPYRVAVGPPPPDLSAGSVEVASESGSVLRGWLVPAVTTATATPRGALLVLHGIHNSRKGMIGRARFLARAGYAVLLVDLQAHGESPGERITFGLLESKDAEACVAFLRARFPALPLGAIGVSMGGAALLLARDPLPLAALVIESTYPTIEQAAAGRMRRLLGKPGEWIAAALIVPVRWRLGFGKDDLHPIEHIADVGCPLFLMHGSADRSTTLAEAEALFAAAREPKEMLAFPGADHVDLHKFDPQTYETRVLDFLGRHLR